MKLSIIIPAYNAKDTIKEAVDSALRQNFPKNNFEVIVVNDGSTDKTLEVLKNYGNQIIVITQSNQGAVRAANNGFRQANGNYVIKLDADDYFEPTIINEMAFVLDKNPDIDFIYCDYYERNPGIKIVSTKNIFNTVSAGIMFRKKSLTKQGFYNEKLKFPEYDLLLKTKNKWKGYRIDKPLYSYNRSPESITGDKKWVKEAIAELEKIYPDKIADIKKIRKY